LFGFRVEDLWVFSLWVVSRRKGDGEGRGEGGRRRGRGEKEGEGGRSRGRREKEEKVGEGGRRRGRRVGGAGGGVRFRVEGLCVFSLGVMSRRKDRRWEEEGGRRREEGGEGERARGHTLDRFLSAFFPFPSLLSSSL
jgi:hypothetical protein